MHIKILSRDEWTIQNKKAQVRIEKVLGVSVNNTGTYEEYLDYMESTLLAEPNGKVRLYEMLKNL